MSCRGGGRQDGDVGLEWLGFAFRYSTVQYSTEPEGLDGAALYRNEGRIKVGRICRYNNKSLLFFSLRALDYR